jgi:pimeloyl-ACP methyl ester carboxylesterase
MIRTLLPGLLHYFIRASIVLLRSIAPISGVIVAYFAWTSSWPRTPFELVVFGYAFAEVFFFVCVYLPLCGYLQWPSTHPEPLSEERRHTLLNRIAENIPDPDSYLQKWFLDSPVDEIKSENMKEFERWAFWGTADPDMVSEEDLAHSHEIIEKQFGRKFEEGRGNAKSMRVTLDDIKFLHRPLIWYVIVGILDHIAATSFLVRGFTLYREKIWQIPLSFPWRLYAFFSPKVSAAEDIPYWYKPHKSKTSLPVLFIHGIGLGLFPYNNFMKHLASLKDDAGDEIGIIALDLLAISARVNKPIPLNHDLCRQILAIIDTHNWNKFVLVGNSYGTMVSSRMLHNPDIAPRIGPMFLVDPVVFLLHQPTIAYNFTARDPTSTMEHVIWYFASKDPLVAHTLQRRTFWIESILWKEDLEGRDVTVAIAGDDVILNASATKKYLLDEKPGKRRKVWGGNEAWRGNGLELLWFDGLGHAEMFQWEEQVKVLMNVVRSYAVGGDQGEKLAGDGHRYKLRSRPGSPHANPVK